MFNLLADSAQWTSIVPIIVIVVILIAFFVWSFLSQRKKQKAFNDTVNSIKPGSKVKTIGGIVGEVVEVNEGEGTFVLKTGDSQGNCSYMKFDKQAIYQTDAKPEEKTEVKEEEKQESAEQPAEEVSEQPEEAKTEEKAEETEKEDK